MLKQVSKLAGEVNGSNLPIKVQEASNKVDSSSSSDNNTSNNLNNNNGDEDTTLFVGDLPGNCVPADLEGLFDIFGVIDDIQVKIIRTSKQNFSYAFVRYENRESALMAFNQLRDNLMLGSYKLRLGWAFRNKSLHIGNIDMIVTEKDLRFLFASYGELENNDGIILFRKDIPGYTNYAHVNFQNRDDAAAAKSALNQSEFFGRYLRVEWNRSPKKFTEAAISLNSNMSSPIATAVQVTGHTTNVLIPTTGHIMAPTNDRGTYVCCPVLSIYVQFETVQEGARVSEATIRNIFEPFGGVTGCYIKSNYLSADGKRQYGYGFVHFDGTPDGEASAKRAVTSLSSCVLNGVAYRSEVSKNFKRATGTLIDDFDGSNDILTASGPVVEAFAPYYYDNNQTNQNSMMIPEMNNHPSQVMYYYYQPNRGYNPTGFNITVSDQNNNLFVLPLPMNEDGYPSLHNNQTGYVPYPAQFQSYLGYHNASSQFGFVHPNGVSTYPFATPNREQPNNNIRLRPGVIVDNRNENHRAVTQASTGSLAESSNIPMAFFEDIQQ